jgi:predicted dehydrogenase
MKKPTASSQGWNRRDFLKSAALTAGAVTFGVPTLLRGQNLNSKVNIAFIGCGGPGSKGVSDTACCSAENVYALCDVDVEHSAPERAKYPDAKFYQDYRKLLDEVGKNIDAVSISTPDHAHAIIASRAMRMGKAVYCQKPLTQTVNEARYLRNLAHETGVVTQMGNQGSSLDGLRRAIEIVQAGVIGPVRQVHVWTNRPIWPQGMSRPDGSDPVPDTLNWDIWLGPAPERPFKKDVYHTFKWRGWQDFGTGALGDMACHTVNMPFRALGFGYPTEIEAQVIGVMNTETYPIGSKIRFEFPARKFKVPAAKPSLFHKEDSIDQVATTLWWYDGGQPKAGERGGHDGSNKPPADLTADCEALLGEIPGSGCLLIGDKGTIFSPDDYGEQFFIKLKDDKKFVFYKKHAELDAIPQSIPRNEFKGDTDLRHHLEWINAIKQGKPELCFSRFDITAQLTEIMLLGCVAIRSGQKLEWDGPAMRATNAPDAVRYVKRENRPGWVLS